MKKSVVVVKKPQIDLGLEIRKEVLTTALVVENFTGIFLGSLLGITDFKNSNVLGNKGGALSFNQKVDMLIEIGALSSTDKSKFQTFMEIRNQFMHNMEASSYEKCFDTPSLNGKEKFILKLYPQEKTVSRERQLELATKKLGEEVVRVTMDLIKSVNEKFRKEAEASTMAQSHQAFVETIKEVKTGLDEFFNKEIAKGDTFDSKRLKGFGTQVAQLVSALWKKNFKKLNPATPAPAQDNQASPQ